MFDPSVTGLNGHSVGNVLHIAAKNVIHMPQRRAMRAKRVGMQEKIPIGFSDIGKPPSASIALIYCCSLMTPQIEALN